MEETFLKENSLPQTNLLHTFLLDQNNKLVLLGNPIDNEKLKSLYKTSLIKISSVSGLN